MHLANRFISKKFDKPVCSACRGHRDVRTRECNIWSFLLQNALTVTTKQYACQGTIPLGPVHSREKDQIFVVISDFNGR